MAQTHCESRWVQSLNNPGAAYREWLKELNVDKNFVHSYLPVLKGEGDTKYLEQVALLNGDGGSMALRASGQNGFSTKPFIGGQPLLDEFRIVWVGRDEDLKKQPLRREIYLELIRETAWEFES